MTDRVEKDKKWEQVQIKAFTSWFNSVLAKRDLRIENIESDLCDGVALLSFLEISNNKKMLQSWNKRPQMRVHKIENQSIALNYITNDMKVRLVGIGAEDLADGSTKLTLGLLWSLFRRMNIENINEEGKSSEDGLLLWIQKMTADYNHVNVENFKDSFSDGMAFSALIHKFNPELIDFDSIDPSAKAENLTRAFAIAEERLGIPKLLEVEDLVRGGNYIDERSVILYSSLFFHAFVADEQRRALAGETTKITSKLQDVQSALEEARARNAALEEELRRVREQEVASSASRISELEEKIRQLQEEIRYLRDRSLIELEMRELLEEKVAALQALIDQTSEERSSSDEERAKLRREIQELRAHHDKLHANLESMENERVELVTTTEEREGRLRELENRKSRLQAEIQELRDRIALETARRMEKSAEVDRLKKEIQTLKAHEIVQSKARVGLDLLRQSLEEHLEDLHHWRSISDIPELTNGTSNQSFDLAKVIADLSGKTFESQLDYLGEQLRNENSVLQRSVALNDSRQQLENVVLKEGSLTMKGRKEWRQRWFRIIGSRLNYYEDENSTDIAGSIQLDQGCDVVRQKAVKDDAATAASTKKLWPLKLTVGDRKLFVKAATKKERHAWFLSLTSKIAHLNYVKSCETANERPDTRILSAFSAERFTECYLDSKPLSDNAVAALGKGFPGRDEIEIFSARDASLSEKSLLTLAELFEKLTIKTINLSGNHFTANAVDRLSKALAATTTLEELHLANANIDSAGASALAALITANPNLTVLNLTGNQIDADGAAAIATAALESKLRSLDLGNNRLGDAGASAVATFVRTNKSASAINLQSNSIGDAGATAIADALAHSINVTNVDLSNNDIAASGAVALRAAFSTNTNINAINISGNVRLVSGSAIADLLTADGISFPQLTIARA